MLILFGYKIRRNVFRRLEVRGRRNENVWDNINDGGNEEEEERDGNE